MCPALLLQQLNFGFGVRISQEVTVMGAGHSSCCSDPSPAIPLQAGVSRAAPHMLEGRHGWCPGGNCRVDKSLPSSTALLQISDFCSKLFIYGKNHFLSLRNCQSWDYPTGVICSFAFKPLFGHRELSVRSISSPPSQVGEMLGAASQRISSFH